MSVPSGPMVNNCRPGSTKAARDPSGPLFSFRPPRAKAIRDPSGDQVGQRLSPACVICRSLEAAGIAKVQEPARKLDERVLNQILGESAVTGDQVREPDRAVRVEPVQVGEPSPIDPDRLQLGLQRSPLPHVNINAQLLESVQFVEGRPGRRG